MLFTLVWFFTEDQILLSDCASSLAVQVEFSLYVLSANIPAFVCRHICFCMQAGSLWICMLFNRWLLIFFVVVDWFAYQLIFSALADHVPLLSCTGLPQDVRSASAGGLQSKCWIHVTFWLVHMLLQRCIFRLCFVMLWMQYLNPGKGAKIITSNLHYTRYGYDINISILAGSKMVTYSAYLLVEIQCFNLYTLLSLCALVCPHYFVSRLDAGESGQQFWLDKTRDPLTAENFWV